MMMSATGNQYVYADTKIVSNLYVLSLTKCSAGICQGILNNPANLFQRVKNISKAFFHPPSQYTGKGTVHNEIFAVAQR